MTQDDTGLLTHLYCCAEPIIPFDSSRAIGRAVSAHVTTNENGKSSLWTGETAAGQFPLAALSVMSTLMDPGTAAQFVLEMTTDLILLSPLVRSLVRTAHSRPLMPSRARKVV
ncbi:MAG: hypothetical protein ACREEK_18595 [Bradyrhizobium sp.]